MMKRTTMLIMLLAAMLMLMAAPVACGVESESGDSRPAAAAAPQMQQAPAAPAPAAAQAGLQGRPGLPGAPGFPGSPVAPAQPAAPASAPTAVPAAASERVVLEKLVLKEVEAEAMSEDAPQVGVGEFSEERAALVAQNRIIVRTVQLALEVNDVAASIEEISQSVQQDGGWVVSTDRGSKHFGFISVRVPASKLDDTLKWMRLVGVDVLSEASTSTDVTDEYYDLRSRVTSLQATEEALIKLLDRAEDVEDALEVQRELARLQVEIESHLGRIKLLEETAAFSLVNISLHLAPQEMRVDAGEDRTFSVDERAMFRATFYPPEGIDDFRFTWDFGDGSAVENGSSSAPRPDGGRITATISHRYRSDEESPFIVEVKMTGSGDAGVVEGSDTFIATVTELPAISVFAGEYLFVEEGEEVEFSGSFTRPKGLSNYRYTWEFSDGSEALTGAPEEGATTVTAIHVYENHRPEPFYATLTVSAESEAGSVEGTATIEVFVQETEGFVITGWSAGDNLKDAVRALSGVAQVTGTAIIWIATFSPVWIVLAIVVVAFIWFRRRLLDSSRRRAPSDSGTDDSYLSTAQDEDTEERD